jgi:N-acetylmuramoyl-L-alanine amidase
MNPQSYNDLTDAELYALCVWRESSNQQPLAQTGVAWTIRNRVEHPGWWGDSYRTVILKPWQFSSFNVSDPNNTRWPEDGDESWPQVQAICTGVLDGTIPDPTNGATSYYDNSISFPKAWGNPMDWSNCANLGSFKFWKQIG